MAYLNNQNLPGVRMAAVEFVRQGENAREVAYRYGLIRNTILNWLHRQPEYGRYGRVVIPTRSFKPCRHPDELGIEIIDRILELQSERQQCAEILHRRLKNGTL